MSPNAMIGSSPIAAVMSNPRLPDNPIVECNAAFEALTGYGRDNDRARALAARFDEHLVKPDTPERLFDVLQQLIPPASA